MLVQSIRKFSHFRESWTLWRTTGGEYEIDGDRMFESPRGVPHHNRFIATLSHDLRLLELKEFVRLKFRRDSGPLTCKFPAAELRCDSGAKDPRHRVDVKVSMDLPYGVIWPLSAFSLAGLTRAASPQVDQPSRIQVVRLEEVEQCHSGTSHPIRWADPLFRSEQDYFYGIRNELASQGL